MKRHMKNRSDYILSLLNEDSEKNEEEQMLDQLAGTSSTADEAPGIKIHPRSSIDIAKKPKITPKDFEHFQYHQGASDIFPLEGTTFSSSNLASKLDGLLPQQHIIPQPITTCESTVPVQFTDEIPKDLTELNCVEITGFESEHQINFIGGSAPPSVLPQLYDVEIDSGPRSAGLPLQNHQEFDIQIPSITSEDFHIYHPRPPSSTFEEPYSNEDFRITSSETSWIPDSEEESSPRKIARTFHVQVPDSDATSVTSSVLDVSCNRLEVAQNSPGNSQLVISPSLIANAEYSVIAPLSPENVTSSTQFIEPEPLNSHSSNDPQTSAPQPHLSDSARRWKKSDPTKWKKNINKNNKYNCKTYFNSKGVLVPAKKPKVVDCLERNCKFRCTEFTEDDRDEICKGYWSLKGYRDQKEFILRHVQKHIPLKHLSSVKTKNRTTSRFYYFYKQDEQIRVCSNFFMATLSISNGPINKAFKHADQYGNFIARDNRGKRSPKNKTNPDDVKFLRHHIESFPTMESHYCRQSTKRSYLDQNLSISKMYQMYKQLCTSQDKTPLSQSKYRAVFGTEYNLSFFVPKKDQCSICFKYKKDPTKYEKLYNEHIQRKTSAAEAKRQDKDRSMSDATYLSVTADLQSVLQIPSGDVGELYYTRKLCVYNFTIYESKPPNKGHCFMWNEINGKRGSSEIATCLLKWIETIPNDIKEISIYSDTCSGQNRNQFIAAFLVTLIQTCHLEIIEQKYLESGHTMMEVDSMHSAIESEKKRTSIFSMNDWKNVAKKARSKRHRKDAPPYEVRELKFDEIIDTKDLAAKVMLNKSKAQDNTKIKWLKVKRLRYEKCCPGQIKFSYSYSGEYSILDTTKSQQKSKKKKKVCWNPTDNLPKAYASALKISRAKKKDLLNLCRTDIIPVELHSWFESLEDNAVTDKLPEPDALEESEEED